MKNRKIISLLLIFSVIFIFTASPITAADTDIKLYVYPAITDLKILPDSEISEQYLSDVINLDGAAGEYRAASFVIKPTINLTGVNITASDLTGAAGTLAGSAVDLRVVKSWYQASDDVTDISRKMLTPELLLKDDSLVKVENSGNYVKLTNGSYQWISQETYGTQRWNPIKVTDMPIRDSDSLQSFDIAANTNKQIWLTVHIPENAAAGDYSGTLTVSCAGGVTRELQLNLDVWPITLDQPYLIYSGYYTSTLNAAWLSGSISDRYKSVEQYQAELANMVTHGLTNPVCYQGFDESRTNSTLLGQVMQLRAEQGMSDQPLYYYGLTPEGYQPIDQVISRLNLFSQYGVTDVYFYGQDEATGAALSAQRDSWNAIKAAGGKIFVSGYTAQQAAPGNYALMGDIQDLMICAGKPDAAEAALWHSSGQQIFNYANPQFGNELPATYRVNFGLLLWQNDYDGAMNFAYQFGQGNIWNDFDYYKYRDHVMAYPTINGVVDTIQWEGFREAVNDVRYLTTLVNTIDTARANGTDTGEAENWLAALKKTDLKTLNMDVVRSRMIDFIVDLQNTEVIPELAIIEVIPTNPAVESSIVEGSIASVLVNAGATQSFTARGYDAAGNPIDGLTFNWSVNDPAVGTIDGNGNFIAGDNPGTYVNAIQVSSGSVSTSTTVTVIHVYETWDVNQDDVTNILDLILAIQHSQESGEPGWIAEDVNADGSVNELDRQLIIAHFTR
jgi:hypothetical protein